MSRGAAAILLGATTALGAPPICEDDVSAPPTEAFLAGDVDAFAPPPEPSEPSPSLVEALPDGKPRIDFDERAVNARLAHTFVDLPRLLDCNGPNTLEFRMRATGVIPRTDGLFLMRSDGSGVRSDDHWRITLVDLAGCGWGLPGCDDGTFVIDLCDLPDRGISPNGHDELVSRIAARGELEIDFQDDTMVDYLLLSLTAGSCGRPRPSGYWYRQCLGVPASAGGLDPGPAGSGPHCPTEPAFESELMACADAKMTALGFGESTCSGLSADPPGDRCERAEKLWTARILDACAGHLPEGCSIDARRGCSATTAGELLEEVAELLRAGDCRTAEACLSSVRGHGSHAPGRERSGGAR